MEFEWDSGKAFRNTRKHKVSFNDAATVFGDFLSTTVPDPDHSRDENRYLRSALSGRGSCSSSPTHSTVNAFGLSVRENSPEERDMLMKPPRNSTGG